jgi:periplasmic divalent cation tolerance protein
MQSFCVITTTFADEVSAEKIIALLLEQKIVACAQILPVKSFYRWEGKVCEASERLVVMKTKSSLFGAVEALIKEHHPYEIPQLLQIPIQNGLEAYLHWIDQETIES